MSEYAIVTSISQTHLLPPNPIKRLDRQAVGLCVDTFDYVEFRGIPEAPANASIIVGEGSGGYTPHGDDSDWRMDVDGSSWCLHTRTGEARYEDDLIAGIYED